MPYHVYIFIGYQPAQSLPGLMREIKAGSSGFINGKKVDARTVSMAERLCLRMNI